MPLPGTEQDQKKFYLAVAQNRVTQIGAMADIHTSEIQSRGSAEFTEQTNIALLRDNAETQIVSIENFAMLASAQVHYSVDAVDASFRGQAEIDQATYQIANIRAEAAYSVSTIQGETKAQATAIGQEALIRVATTQGVTAAQQTTISTEADIDAARYAALAVFAVAEIRARVAQDSATAIAVARIEAGAITQEASIRASATTQIAGIEAANISAEAEISAATTSALAAIDVEWIDASASNQARTEIESAIIRSTATRTTADIRSDAAISRANIDAQNQVDLATIRAAIDIYVASSRARVAHFVADNDYSATIFVADNQYALTVYRADSQYQSTVQASDLGLSARQYAADKDYSRAIAVAQSDATARNQAADYSYQALVIREDADTSINARKLQWQKQGWDMVIPQFNATKTGFSLPSWWSSLPPISQRGVIHRSSVDRRINALWAKEDARFGNRSVSLAGEVGGRGWNSAGAGIEQAREALFAESIETKATDYAEAQIGMRKKQSEASLIAQKANADAIDAQNRVALALERAWNERQVGYLEQAAAFASP